MSSNLPISSPYRSKPEAPVTEAEREQLSSRLNAAFTEGTLSQDDYQSRLDRLFLAQKLGELVPVVDGLPPLQTHSNPAIVTSGGQPGQLAEAKAATSLSLVILAGLVGVVLLILLLVLVIL